MKSIPIWYKDKGEYSITFRNKYNIPRTETNVTKKEIETIIKRCNKYGKSYTVRNLKNGSSLKFNPLFGGW